MNANELEAAVKQCLIDVAPELEPSRFDKAKPFRDQLDLDSIDFLRFVQALAKKTGVEIAEADYSGLGTVEACARFLGQRLSRGGPPSA